MFTIHDNYFDALRAAELGKHILRVDNVYLVQHESNEEFRKITLSLMTCNEVGATVQRYLRMSDFAYEKA